MRYAIISDIHGNLEALQAVLEDVQRRNVDQTYCLGDIVGYYPDPEACIELIRAHANHCIAGNHDYAAIERIDTKSFTYYAYVAMEWTKHALSEKAKQFLGSLPLTFEDAGVFFAHASPNNSEEWNYVFPDSESAIFEAFSSLNCRVNFIGHTHWPSIMIQDDEKIVLHNEHSIRINKKDHYLVNVGSVGQPRDFDPRSCYAIYDTEEHDIALHRVEYDLGATQRKIIKHNLPLFLAERLANGR